MIVAPTAHLKVQWAAAATRLGLHLDPAWSPADGALPRGHARRRHQLPAGRHRARPSCGGSPGTPYVVLDEVHHAGEEQAWGDAVRHAFDGSARRLSLSGTPFRSDTRAIPFVRYEADEAVPDFEYGYGDALRDGRVVRPVYFPRIGGEMEWSAPDGSGPRRRRSTTRSRPSSPTSGCGPRCRSRASGCPPCCARPSARLTDVRRHQPDAGGLVIAIDQDHARGIAALLRRRVRAAPAVGRDLGRPGGVAPDRRSSPRAASRGWSPCGWSARASTSRGCASACTRRPSTTDLFFRQAVGPVRALGARDPRPARVAVHPRRPPAADPGRRDRRGAPALAAQGPPRRRGRGRAAPPGGATRRRCWATSCRCSRRCPRWRSPATDRARALARAAPRRRGRLRPRRSSSSWARRRRSSRRPDGEDGLTRREAKDRLRVANAEAAKDIARASGARRSPR